MNSTFKRKQVLAKCIALSLLTHAGIALLLQHHAIWLYHPSSAKAPSAKAWIASMNKQTQTDILATALTPSEAIKSRCKEEIKAQKEKECLSCQINIGNPSYLSPYFSFSPPPFDPTQLLVSNSEVVSSMPLPSQKSFHLPSHIPKEMNIPTEEEPSVTKLLPPPNFHPEETIAFHPVMPNVESTSQLSKDVYAVSTVPDCNLPRPIPIAPPLYPTWLSVLPQLPTLEELETTTYSEEFDIDLAFMPRENDLGYLFVLTLIPKTDLYIPPMQQHYLFLIDRANSIQKERLSHTKIAVSRAIEQLHPEDSFNIIVFDSKMEKLFPSQMPATRSALAEAQQFLNKIELGSFFSPADLYKPLLLTVPSRVAEDEIYTVILLTDGDSLAKKGAQLSLLQQWSQYNQGRVTLHTLGMTGDKHLQSLEALCALNRGQSIQSTTKRGIKRKLLKLLKTVQKPLIKNISCHAFSRSPNSIIEIYPENTHTQHLYSGQPYTIIGTAETIDDFVLFIQGRIKDRWLNIKKTISFISARKGDNALQIQWARQKIYGLYEQYLQDKNPEHLAEARMLLDPLQLPSAFQ